MLVISNNIQHAIDFYGLDDTRKEKRESTALTMPATSRQNFHAIIFTFGNVTSKVIAHEVFHVSGNILHERGYRLGRLNSESQAYLIGDITEKVYKFLNTADYEE